MIKKIAKNGKIFGIIAVVVAGISFVIPVIGVFLACFLGTILVALSLKDGAILGYVAGGLNIINGNGNQLGILLLQINWF